MNDVTHVCSKLNLKANKQLSNVVWATVSSIILNSILHIWLYHATTWSKDILLSNVFRMGIIYYWRYKAILDTISHDLYLNGNGLSIPIILLLRLHWPMFGLFCGMTHKISCHLQIWAGSCSLVRECAHGRWGAAWHMNEDSIGPLEDQGNFRLKKKTEKKIQCCGTFLLGGIQLLERE